MPKYTITADDGTQFIGAAQLVDNLPDEYAREIKKQIQAASEGKAMEAVNVPRGLLEQAGWMSKEDYVAEQEEAKASTPHEEPPPTQAQSPTRPQRIVPPPDMTMCEKCPFKETAMKLIEKTLRGLE